MNEDFLPIKRIDHVEYYVGNAKQATHYYCTGFGFRHTAYSGLETDNRDTASYVLEQGKIRLVLTTALGPDHPISRHCYVHGDGVASHYCSGRARYGRCLSRINQTGSHRSYTPHCQGR